MKLLLDGWDLIYHPLSPSAIHTVELLTSIPNHFQIYLAIPQVAPDWLLGLNTFLPIYHELENNPKDRLIWQQLVLPKIIQKTKASVLHLTHPFTPILRELPVVFSPAQYTLSPVYQRRSLFWERLLYATAAGGIDRMDRFLFPNDLLPPSDHDIPIDKIYRLPPPAIPFKLFSQPTDIPVPSQPYFLYIGNGETALLFSLLNAWNKVSAALGDEIHLCILPSNEKEKLLMERFQSSSTIHLINFHKLNPLTMDGLIAQAQAFIQLTPEPYWGGFARRALLSGIPLIGFDSPSLSQIVGDAGYLVEGNSDHLLSAAMITMVVEEEINQALKNKAALRQTQYQNAAFSSQIEKIYQEIR